MTIFLEIRKTGVNSYRFTNEHVSSDIRAKKYFPRDVLFLISSSSLPHKQTNHSDHGNYQTFIPHCSSAAGSI